MHGNHGTPFLYSWCRYNENTEIFKFKLLKICNQNFIKNTQLYKLNQSIMSKKKKNRIRIPMHEIKYYPIDNDCN